MPLKPIPDGYHAITPYLVVPGVGRLIDFCIAAFGATVRHRMARPDGTVMHAEIEIGDSRIMMGEPQKPGDAMPSMLYHYVPNVDEVYARAIQAGATEISSPADQFYGDRHGGIKDPSGNTWWISTHIEDVSPEEIARRASQRQQ